MAEKRVVGLCVIASVFALVGLLAVPGGVSRLWAFAQDRPQIIHQAPTGKVRHTAIVASAMSLSSPSLSAPAPTTLEDYAREVQDRLQTAARQVNTSGIADVRLTIDRDGSVRQTEVTRLDGPEALRTQLMTIARQMQLPPLPTGTPVDTLVVDTIVVFNYPGNDIMDRFGRTS